MEQIEDKDLATMSKEELIFEVKKLRDGIRTHRDSSGHDLCWHHPNLWSLLPGNTDPIPAVPDWPQFIRGCIRYRESLEKAGFPRTNEEYEDSESIYEEKKIDVSNFKRLIGIWTTAGEIKSGQDSLKLTGIDSYELILDGNCILHKASVKIGDAPSETLEIIKLNNSPGKAKMHYFNSQGEGGVMTGLITGNEFKIEGNTLKFEGTIDDENTEINGKWYILTKNEEWTEFIDLKLEKRKNADMTKQS